jgi:peroxiredoxin
MSCALYGSPVGRLARLLVVSLAIGASRADADDARPAAATERPIAGFSLRDFGGKTFALADFKQQKCVVVVFLGTQCPLAKLYAARLQKLADDYRARHVAVVGIDSNSQDSIAALAAFAREHQIKFPLLMDPGAVVADQFAAQRTPAAFVLDQKRVIRYHGRIDDQYGVGYTRPEPKRQDLRQALDELLGDSVVSQPVTEPAGCLIGRLRKPDEHSSVTFSNQISRLFNRRCVECHRAGEIGPFSLTDYREAAGWAGNIAEAVAEGRMPPWHANPKFGCFADDRSLLADEKKLIADWVAAGAPEGNRAQAPEKPKFLASGWQLPRQPDTIVPMSTTPFKVPAEGTVEYQFFVVDPGYKEDKWFTAAEVLPGNRSVVHHLLVFAFTKGLEEAMRDGTIDGFLAVYVPGMRTTSYPPGMAKRIPAGSRLVFQVHYTANGSEQLDLSKLGLIFTDPKSVQYEVLTSSVTKRSLVIPPRTKRCRITAESPPSSEDSYLLALMPHMHLRGSAFNFHVILPAGKAKMLLDVPHFDSNWQTNYRLQEPISLPAGTRLRSVACFDNSESNPNNPDPTKTVRWGLQSKDEMLVGYFDIAVRKRPDTMPMPSE